MFSRSPGVLAVLGVMALMFALSGSAGASFSNLHNCTSAYDSGAGPVGQLVQGPDGSLYGLTQNGVNGWGNFFKMSTSGAVTTIHEFAAGTYDAGWPCAGLLYHNGEFYGTSRYGGANESGTVFKISPTGKVTLLHTFFGGSGDGMYPYSALLLGSDGYLYGTTYNGGDLDEGTVYKIGLNGGNFHVIHSFVLGPDEVCFPLMKLAEGRDGKLYGASDFGNGSTGGVFKLNRDGSNFTPVYSFANNDLAGMYPLSDLISGSDGNLYGTCCYGGAYGMGTVFKVDTTTGKVSPVWSFDGYSGATPGPAATGDWCQYTLMQSSVDNMLYGVTFAGGAYGFGTAFQLSTTGAIKVIANFTRGDSNGAPNPLMQATDKNFYATSFFGGISAVLGGKYGNPNGYGAAFRIKNGAAGYTLKVIHSFYLSDVYQLWGPLVQYGSAFYGVAVQGGIYGGGAIYKVDAGGHFSVLHPMNDYLQEGKQPCAGLLKATDGKLYGTAQSGGKFGYGTIFSVGTTGRLTVIHHLSVREGATPSGALLQAADKTLYGTCWGGGPAGYGTVYATNPSGSNFRVLHYFGGSDGCYPYCTLTQDSSGNLYGATSQGGANGYGTVFKLNTTGSSFQTLFNFDGTNGAYPSSTGQMVLAGGYLYGTTAQGGQYGGGALFRTDASTGATSVFHAFNNGANEGYFPSLGVAADASGNLYGTCAYGGVGGLGTVWKVDPSGVLTVLHVFQGPALDDGSGPNSGVIIGADGFLYGTTLTGGAPGATGNVGMIFQQTMTP